MTNKKPTSADMVEFFESLHTKDSIMENSAIIYAAAYQPLLERIDTIIRFDPTITTEQLDIELLKVKGLLNHVDKSPDPVANEACLNNIKGVIENRKRVDSSMESYTNKLMILTLEDELFDDHASYNYTGNTILEGFNYNYASEITEMLNSKPLITPIGMTRTINLIASSEFPDEQSKEESINQLGTKICNTVKYECNKGGEYKDIPALAAFDSVVKYLNDLYNDSEKMLIEIGKIVDKLTAIITDNCSIDIQYCKKACETEVPVPAATFNPNGGSIAGTSQFNPNPNNVWYLTPLGVVTREVRRSMLDIFNADTDEEIEEALLHFGRLETACEMMVMEGNSKIAKGARAVSRKVANTTNKVTGKVSSTAKDVKIAAKKAVDPMANFVESSVAKFKAADEAERREIILKGKTEGSLLKILRWIKRGIPLIIIGNCGSVGAMVAGIAFITRIVTDKYCDNKTRVKMLRELEQELAIVDEKIEDSKGDDNKQAKYELMRIRNQLKSDIDKISLRLNY